MHWVTCSKSVYIASQNGFCTFQIVLVLHRTSAAYINTCQTQINCSKQFQDLTVIRHMNSKNQTRKKYEIAITITK